MIFLEKVTFDEYRNYRQDGHIDSNDNPTIFTTDLNFFVTEPISFYCIIKYLESSGAVHSVGTVSFRHNGQITKLRDLEIHDQYRGNGYSKSVLEIIIRQAKSCDSLYISLFVFGHRKIAINLYKKYGFQKVKQMDKGTEMVLYLSKP